MQCLNPISIKRPNGNGNGDRITVPCGRCSACLSNLRQQWTFRVTQEFKKCYTSYFITLTYEDKNLYVNENGIPSVSKRHIQLFFKKLRKTQKRQIRYYLSSEYGPKTKRPHYHAIIFDIENTENIHKCWDNGFVRIDPVNEARIAYTTKYCITKAKIPKLADKVFSLMSRRPAIGHHYLQSHAKWHEADPSRFYVSEKGIKQSMPRYYKNKLYGETDRANYAEQCELKIAKLKADSQKKFEQTNSKNYEQYLHEQKEEFVRKTAKSQNKSIL